jgi:TPR repeat protein
MEQEFVDALFNSNECKSLDLFISDKIMNIVDNEDTNDLNYLLELLLYNSNLVFRNAIFTNLNYSKIDKNKYKSSIEPLTILLNGFDGIRNISDGDAIVEQSTTAHFRQLLTSPQALYKSYALLGLALTNYNIILKHLRNRKDKPKEKTNEEKDKISKCDEVYMYVLKNIISSHDNTYAMMQLAKIYEKNGQNFMALQTYNKASKFNDTDAMRKLGIFRIRKNNDTGSELLKKSAELGNVSAQEDLAHHYFNIGQLDKAIDWFVVASNNFSQKACVFLINVFYYGMAGFTYINKKNAYHPVRILVNELKIECNNELKELMYREIFEKSIFIS